MSDIKNMEKLKKYKSKLSNSTNFEKQKIYIAKINEYTALLNQSGGADTTAQILADIETKLASVTPSNKLLIATDGSTFDNNMDSLRQQYTKNLKDFAKCKHMAKSFETKLEGIKNKLNVENLGDMKLSGNVDFYVYLLELVDLLDANDEHNTTKKLIEIVNNANNESYDDIATNVSQNHIEKALSYIVDNSASGYNANSGLQKTRLKTAVNTVTNSADQAGIDDNKFDQT